MKGAAQVICAFLLVLALIAPASAAKKRSTPKKKSATTQRDPSFNTDLQKEMTKYLGIRYRTGGTTTSGVDCSGFAGLIYRELFGLELPHRSASIYVSSALNRVREDSLTTGDLVFFTPSRKNKRISHVGIYLSEGKFIHAARGNGVVVSKLDDPHWSARFVGARRMPGLEKRFPGESSDSPWDFTPSSDPRGFFASPLTAAFSVYSDSTDNTAPVGTQIMGRSLGLELGLVKGLQENGSDLLRLSVFQESLLIPRGIEPSGPFLFMDENSWSGDRPAVASVRGIRLGGDIRPFDWLRLTPSLSFFDYDAGVVDTGLPRRSVGMDLTMGSLEAGWVLSTGLRYSSLNIARADQEDGDPTSELDMSLTLTQRVSRNLMISIMGERLQRLGTVASESYLEERNWEDKRFSLIFSFSY